MAQQPPDNEDRPDLPEDDRPEDQTPETGHSSGPPRPDEETIATPVGSGPSSDPAWAVRRSEADLMPERIGQYQIKREIGRGGIGVVYAAVRDDDRFKKRVAIKLLKRGMDTDDLIRRFELERDLLSALNHPNIARLLDGGITEDGRSFFVLEYIDGVPIDRYCDENRLGIDQRLQLFRGVCDAVHYAHKNLVVHRDIKPGNILVTKDGVPKLLDFGIAKLINPGPAQLMEMTRTELRLMTPEYASPEQVRGQSITTSSDVYSLGVLLYELLTGHRPYQLKSRLQREIERVICEEEPERPSTAVTKPAETVTSVGTRRTTDATTVSATRGTVRPDRLRRRLAGDLDNIVLKAMRKDPERRYLSAEQFSADIERHLSGMPITARAETLPYVMAKFVRRNRAAVGVAAAFVLVLVAGIAATSWQASVAAQQRDRAEAQRDIAQRRFDQVRQLANTFLFDFHDAIVTLDGSVPARQLVVVKGAEYLEGLTRDAKDDPTLIEELRDGYLKLGDIRGGLRSGHLGETSGALESYERAVEMSRGLIERDPANDEYSRGMINALVRYSDALIAIGRIDDGSKAAQAAADIASALSDKHPLDAELRRARAITLLKVGDAYSKAGDDAKSLARYRESLAVRRQILERAPDSEQARRDLTVALTRIYDARYDKGDADGALEAARELFEVRRTLAEQSPDSGRAKRDLLFAHRFLGNALLLDGEKQLALDQFRSALDIAVARYEADPANDRARRDLLISHGRYGDGLASLGSTEEALAQFRIQRDLAEQMAIDDPDRVELARYAASAHVRIAQILSVSGRADEAIESLRLAISVYDELPSEVRSDDTTVLASQMETLRDLALLMAENDRAGDALPHIERALALAGERRPDLLRVFALVRYANGDTEAAVRLVDEAVTKLDGAQNDELLVQLREDRSRYETANP